MKIQQLTELVRKTCLQSGLLVSSINIIIKTNFIGIRYQEDLYVTVFYHKKTDNDLVNFSIHQYNIDQNQIQVDMLLKEVEVEVIKTKGSNQLVSSNLEIDTP
jgi:hypothetical protein